MPKRILDLLIAVPAFALLLPVMVLVGIIVRLNSAGPAIFWSERFGRDSVLFNMPKFRTMKVGAPQLPTHLISDGKSLLTSIGGFLRRTSLDELPQLWSVILGHMSLVGPRPALFNQDDLMHMRREAGVDHLRPGITGWAQINGRDDLPLTEKVALEATYMARHSLRFDVWIMFLTVRRVVRPQGIAH